MVLATQNPVELEGTYPLPEAQLDRFFFKLLVLSPSPDELREILQRTTGASSQRIAGVLRENSEQTIADMKLLVREVVIAPPLEDYIVRLVHATQPTTLKDKAAVSEVKEYLRFGSSPRGAQSIILGAKANALVEGRVHVSHEDIEEVIYPSLRHRLILNFQADAENVGPDQILTALIKKVPRN